MRFSTLLGPGRYRIKIPENRISLLDRLFNAASHHYWMARNAPGDSGAGAFHQDLADAHSAMLSRVIAAMDFSEALDPDSCGLNFPRTWLDPKEGPLLTGAFYCNMLPDIRYPFGEAHPDDKLLLRVISDTSKVNNVDDFVKIELDRNRYLN